MSQLTSVAKYDGREMGEWAREMRTPSPKALRCFLIEQIMCFVAGTF
jgi:hypothetical protein